MSSRVVVYVATGEPFASRARESATRLRELGWTGRIRLISDAEYADYDVFDAFTVVDEPHYGLADKPENVHRVDADEAVYLDADTYVVDEQSLSHLFDLLETYDLAGAVDTGRRLEVSDTDKEPQDDIPPSFPWLNTGVLAFRLNAPTREFLEAWRAEHRQLMDTYGPLNDQAAFRRALWDAEITHTVLPPEYNFRLPYPQSVNGEVKILHGPAADYGAIEETINRRPVEQWRQFRTRIGRAGLSEVNKWTNRIGSVRWLSENEGPVATIKRSCREMIG